LRHLPRCSKRFLCSMINRPLHCFPFDSLSLCWLTRTTSHVIHSSHLPSFTGCAADSAEVWPCCRLGIYAVIYGNHVHFAWNQSPLPRSVSVWHCSASLNISVHLHRNFFQVSSCQTLPCPCSTLPSLSITLYAVGATTVAQAPEARPLLPLVYGCHHSYWAQLYMPARGKGRQDCHNTRTDHPAGLKGPRIKRLELWGRKRPGQRDPQRRQRLQVRCSSIIHHIRYRIQTLYAYIIHFGWYAHTTSYLTYNIV
jgi:hypothetical protein